MGFRDPLLKTEKSSAKRYFSPTFNKEATQWPPWQLYLLEMRGMRARARACSQNLNSRGGNKWFFATSSQKVKKSGAKRRFAPVLIKRPRSGLLCSINLVISLEITRFLKKSRDFLQKSPMNHVSI